MPSDRISSANSSSLSLAVRCQRSPQALELRGNLVLLCLRRIRITDHLEALPIVIKDHAAECEGRGLMAKMGADISDAQPALRVGIIGMRANCCGKTRGVAFVVARPLGLVIDGGGAWNKIERKDEIGVVHRAVRVELERAAHARYRLLDTTGRPHCSRQIRERRRIVRAARQRAPEARLCFG